MKMARRYVISSDKHPFVGRIFDLAMPLHLGFQNYKQIGEYPDCLYVIHVNQRVELLTSRVDSLNVVGNMLWTRNIPVSFSKFPISRYQWLNVTADTFLMRLISIRDCVLLLANEIFECGADPRRCNLRELRKAGVPSDVLSALHAIGDGFAGLQKERNHRFHSGFERAFSDDDSRITGT